MVLLGVGALVAVAMVEEEVVAVTMIATTIVVDTAKTLTILEARPHRAHMAAEDDTKTADTGVVTDTMSAHKLIAMAAVETIAMAVALHLNVITTSAIRDVALLRTLIPSLRGTTAAGHIKPLTIGVLANQSEPLICVCRDRVE